MNISGLASSIREIYGATGAIHLHEPKFDERDRFAVLDAIDSTFVSSSGAYINLFEEGLSSLIQGYSAVAVVNGTSSLHISLLLSGVKSGDLVLTQSLTFVATCNAIRYCGASPIFIDVDRSTLGMSPEALSEYLDEHAIFTDGKVVHKSTGQEIKAVLPMHTFGHPVRINEISDICVKWGLILIEDASESLGSKFKGQATGSFGEFSAVSFNGNKIITTGGGGAVLCKSPQNYLRAKHLTTTAKLPHAYDFIHDMVGYNYRMPNLNAALGFAQLQKLPLYIRQKREIAQVYKEVCFDNGLEFCDEPDGATSNFWLNAALCENIDQRQALLEGLSARDIHARPVWRPMHLLPMFTNALSGDLSMTNWLASRLINLPSSPRPLDNHDA